MVFVAKYVTCSKCGKKKFANADAYKKRVEKFGSIEEMEKKWLCRECEKGTKKEETVKE